MKLIKLLFAIPKTVYVNFRVLPLKASREVAYLGDLQYKTRHRQVGVKLNGKVKPFLVRIGFHECDETDRGDTTLLKVHGTLVFEGEGHIGRGSKIIVNEGALLELGDNFAISTSSAISCRKHMKFGRDIQFSWDCLVMDSDTHLILDEQGRRMNEDKDIVFEDKVWIGNSCMILKGAHVPSTCVIGARSVVSGSKFEDHSIIVGNPARSVKRIGDFRI